MGHVPINSRAATDSPTLEDTEAGPDINDDEFKSANEIFKDPSSFDFLSQHGTGNEAAIALARQSLYVKFDPLIGGRPSIMPKNQSIISEDDEESNNNNDLIAMNSPLPQKAPLRTQVECEDEAVNEQRQSGGPKLPKKSSFLTKYDIGSALAPPISVLVVLKYHHFVILPILSHENKFFCDFQVAKIKFLVTFKSHF